MKWYNRFDWVLLISWLVLSIIGLVAIYSATQGPMHQGTAISGNFDRQVLHLGIGLIIIVLMQFLTPQTFMQLSWPGYVLCLIIALLTVFFGIEVGGERNWLNIFGFRLQISEFMKLATVMAIASFLSSQRQYSMEDFKTLFIFLLLIALPVFLITLHGDTGTSLVYIGIIPFLLFWAGLSFGLSLMLVMPAVLAYLTVINIVAAGVVAAVLCGVVFLVDRRPLVSVSAVLLAIAIIIGVQVALTEVLQPHQRARVEAFTNPAVDPHGAGWNVIQAKTAISSGGLYGKGFMQGTQTQLRFLPEQQTDFIFCVISEEFGLVGAGTTLLFFLVLLSRLVYIAGTHKHAYARLTIIGVASVFLVHIIVNLGMATALLPVIGIPLPLISYGGSSFLSFSIMIGLCLNLHFYERNFSIYAS
ncbi:MAG: rod shape-determining protein RodA [Candidatus Cyclonatronum sp.]|uniref:rod shape-determining protein RodA n=1 Tax=Cyclonatronum sp. TaxID=3024185 RepID=UPI0025C34551|nr:rod shape-determining protein RodA [Cyclonatronum sp.]MCC5934216.1 rod shape-determining protein RodA [Balneolales bacterium]MCH8487025.1 rod shape-determining protein RodA [Cyclonatronum sp.]